MSKKTFSITMAIVFVVALSLLVFGACAVKQAEQEVAEVDEYLSESTSETTTTEETTTEAVTTVSETTEEPTTASVEELAEIIVTMGINGDERRAYLGEDYDEVQSYIAENYAVPETYYEVYEEEYYYPSGDVLTPEMGVHDYYGITETYYNLPMDGVVEWMHSLGYGGEYWVRGDGVKMLGDYVMVAADYGWMPKGSIVETSLGTGIVCDTGLGGWYWYDIATNW